MRTNALLLVALTLSAALLSAGFAASQDTTAQPGASAPQPRRELVYAASRSAQTLAEAAASVTLITREEIDAFGWRNLGEILDSVVGIFSFNDRVFNFVTVRGLTTIGDYGSRILVMMNGHRINRATWEYGGFGGDGLVDISSIERVEVIRGAGSSMYGTNALYAVVNIVTRQGSDVSGFEGELAGGSFSTFDGAISFGHENPSSGLEAIVSVSALDSEGDDLYFPEFDDPATNNGMSIGLDDEKHAHAYGQVRFGDFTIEGAAMDRTKGVPTASYTTTFNDPYTEVRDDQMFVAAAYEHSFMNLSRVWASLTYNESSYAGDWMYDGDWRTQDYTDDTVWTLDAQYQMFFGRHSLTVGGEARELESHLGTHDVDPYYLYFEETHDLANRAVFAQGEFRFGSRLTAVAGLRYDWYESFGGTTNPRFALVYKLLEGSSLKLMYNEAFRAPNPSELYYYDGDITWKQSEGLEPETTRSFELAFEHSFGPKLRGSATVYSVEVDDLIAVVFDPEDELLVYRNIGHLESEGIELEISGELFGFLKTRVSYAYQDAHDDAGEAPVGSPTHLARLGLAGSFADNQLSAGLELRYVGDRPRRDGTDEDGYLVAGGRLRYSPFGNDRLTLIGDVDNLFDTEYAHVAGEEHLQETLTMDGLTYRLGVRFRF